MQPSLRNVVRQAVLALGALLVLPFATAAVITLSPASTVTSAGSPVRVDVGVSGLGSGVALGGFDLDIAFNPALLSFTGATFGPALGNPMTFEALTSVSAAAAVVDFSEVSLLSAAQLLALQPGSFSLGILSFDAIASGTATFALLATSLLSDASGQSLPITPAAAAIPEPEAVVLLGIGLAALALRQKRRAMRRRAP
jgi:hypothetical protein